MKITVYEIKLHGKLTGISINQKDAENLLDSMKEGNDAPEYQAATIEPALRNLPVVRGDIMKGERLAFDLSGSTEPIGSCECLHVGWYCPVCKTRNYADVDETTPSPQIWFCQSQSCWATQNMYIVYFKKRS